MVAISSGKRWVPSRLSIHYNDVIMTTIASQITSLTVVYSTIYSDADQRKHQSSASLDFVWGIHRGPVNSLHKGSVTRKMFPFDDVIMYTPCPIKDTLPGQQSLPDNLSMRGQSRGTSFLMNSILLTYQKSTAFSATALEHVLWMANSMQLT